MLFYVAKSDDRGLWKTKPDTTGNHLALSPWAVLETVQKVNGNTDRASLTCFPSLEDHHLSRSPTSFWKPFCRMMLLCIPVLIVTRWPEALILHEEVTYDVILMVHVVLYYQWFGEVELLPQCGCKLKYFWDLIHEENV